MIKIRCPRFMTVPCMVLLFSLSIWTGGRQSSLQTSPDHKDISVITSATSKADEEPYVQLNPFGSWTPDTITRDGAAVIAISLSASGDVPEGTQVTLSFGATVSNGAAGFTITPAEPVAENQFTFSIGPNGQKTITAKYVASNVTGSPDVKAICDMSVPAGITARQSPQTSSSELRIR